jgi:hypothetical protein
MQEEEELASPLDRLDQLGVLAQEYKELKESPLFQKLILQGYLGKQSLLEEQILEGIARDDDIGELKKQYQERRRFSQYLENLESGENSEYYKVLFEKLSDPNLSDQDASDIQQQILSRASRRKT